MFVYVTYDNETPPEWAGKLFVPLYFEGRDETDVILAVQSILLDMGIEMNEIEITDKFYKYGISHTVSGASQLAERLLYEYNR